MTLLVTGGAGYIGSIMTRQLLDAGYATVVLDHFSQGITNVDKRAIAVKGDVSDKNILEQVFTKHEIAGVMHFAGVISMAESMKNPSKYFTSNICSTIQLLDVMVKHRVKTFIFSSTAGVYGNPTTVPIPEDHVKNPTNPYGESKLMVEKILKWYDRVYGVKSVSLRYFNAAGAALGGSLGERHKDETHIIPLAIKALLEEKEFTIYGNDYDTKDGTCVRDYIHVEDLCNAHLLSLKALKKKDMANVYNVGTGKGYSNKEVIDMIEKVTGKKIRVRIGERRPGDASELIADPTKIKTKLGWKPEHSDLETIIHSAWEFHKKHGFYKKRK